MSLAANPLLNDTLVCPGQNASHCLDITDAFNSHIRQQIFDMNGITMEPNFSATFFSYAPPLDFAAIFALEASLGFTFHGLASEIRDATSEKAMYQPIARLFSALALLVKVNENDRCLSLPQDRLWMTVEIATRAPQAASDNHPSHISDLGSVAATVETIRNFIKSGKNPLSTHDWGTMGHTGEVKLRNLPEKDSHTTLRDKTQVISYACSCSRNQANRSGFFAFYAGCNGVQFIWYGVSKVKISPLCSWNNIVQLFSFVYALHRRENMLEDTRLRLRCAPMNRLVPSVLAWQGTDYHLFLLSMDGGWTRKRFIAGGYSQDGGVAVVKLVWGQIGRRLKESRSCEDIHKDGLIAGIVTLLGEQDDSPLVSELLPGETESDTTYVRHMLVYDTIGDSLCSCGSVKTFLIAMFDLVEVLRFLHVKKRMLHGDVSWTNILLNPRRIGGTYKPLAMEQPKSYAYFIDSSHQNISQYNYVDHVTIQRLGTVALLDLELAIKLDPTEGAKEVVDETGTPMFIAMDRTNYRDMPETSSDFWVHYRQYLETSPEGSTPDSWLVFWDEVVRQSHLVFTSRPSYPKELPLHDVESVFWIIVLFFIRASPSDANEEEVISNEDLDSRSQTFCNLSSNFIGRIDWRTLLLGYSEDRWRLALHPRLRPFAPLLSTMASYFKNTWHFFPGIYGERSFHAHEAMRRMLWKTIQNIDEDIPISQEPLDIIMPRSPSYYTMNTARTGKRKANENEDRNEKSQGMTIPSAGTSKRRRFGSSQPLTTDSLTPPPSSEDVIQVLMNVKNSHKAGKRWLQSTKVPYASCAP